MNETFEKLSKKYSLTEQAKLEFKTFFEKEIIKVFHKKSAEISIGKDKETTNVKKNVLKTTKTNSGDICAGKKANGENCTFKSKPDTGYCGRHDPNKETTASKITKPRVKKESKTDCHATIPKTGKKCIQPGTVKPSESNFHYCKRHSENWINFEPETQEELVVSEQEVEKETEETEEEEEEVEEETEEAEE